jgi:hypothetical protein
VLLLTKGSNWPEKQCRGVNVDDGRRRTDGVGEEVAAEVLLASNHRGSAWGVPAEVPRG